jgi:hypothetical protein
MSTTTAPCAAPCTFAILIAAFSAGAAPTPIPITNPSFEDLNITLRPAEQTTGMGAGVTPVGTRFPFPFSAPGPSQTGAIVPGWRTVLNASNSNTLAGVMNPDVAFNTQPWLTGYDGRYIAVAQATWVSQTLNVQLQPRTRYTLRFRGGIARSDFSYFFAVGLVAAPDLATFATFSTPGVTVLGRMPFVEIDPPDFGVMREYSFSSSTPAVLPPSLQGTYLGITFIGSDGFPRVCYDDFRLEAELLPGCPGDFDLSGTRTPADIFAFLSAYFAGDPRADFDQNGEREPADIFAFLTAYFAGGC